MTFIPYQGITLSTDQTAPVAVGQLIHYNYPINCYSNCSKYIPSQFKLDIYVQVQLTSGGTVVNFEGIYGMYLNETPNKDARNPLTATCPLLSQIASDPSWQANLPGGWTPDYVSIASSPHSMC